MSDYSKLTKDQLLSLWNETKTELDRIKAVEAELRKQVVVEFFSGEKKEGTENVLLGNGYKLKCTFKQNYNLRADEVEKALQKIEAMGDEGKFIAPRLVNWKPSLVIKEYRDLSEKMRKIIDGVLTISDGAPSLEIIAPKSK